MLLNLGITVVVLQCVMNVLSFTNPKGPNIRRMIPRPTPTPMKSLRKPLVSWRNETIYVGNPPHVLISGLDLSFGGGQRLAIIGENGCGKSILTQRMARSFSPERYAASTPQRRVLTRRDRHRFTCEPRARVSALGSTRCGVGSAPSGIDFWMVKRSTLRSTFRQRS